MKTTNLNYSFVFLFFVLLCSCSNDDSKNQILLLKQIDEIAVDGTLSTTMLHYNENKITTINSPETLTTFFYTDNLITKIEELDKKTNQLNSLQYNYTNEKLVKITSSNNYEWNYFYNTDGTVTYEKTTKDATDKVILLFHGSLVFKNSNLIKDERIQDDADVESKSTITFDYDRKNNALHTILGFDKLLNYSHLISLNNSNNSSEESVIKYKSTDQITSSVVSHKSFYKYNSFDYPTEIVSQKSIFAHANANHAKTVLYYN